MNHPGSDYKQRIDAATGEIERLLRSVRPIPWLRLVLFLLTGISIYYSVKFSLLLLYIIPVLAFTGFLIAGWVDARLKKKIRILGYLIRINRQEIAAIEGDFSGFEPGNDFTDQAHPYTGDLDIFGTNSLFQYVNRTTTVFGKKRLADYFMNAFHYRDEIVTRQEAIAELAGNIEFRQQLQLIFTDQDTSGTELSEINKWLRSGADTNWLKPLKVLSWIFPAVTLSTMLLAMAGVLHVLIPVTMITLQTMIVLAFSHRTMAFHQAVTSGVGILRKYSLAFTLLEETRFTATFNKNLQERLLSRAHEMPGRVILHIAKLLNLLDSNLNILVSLILNGLFMFNIHILSAVVRWRERYRDIVPEWFTVLAEMDALSSLGTFAFNNPKYPYPEARTDGFIFKAEKIGHPLIPCGTCVTNDIEMEGWNQFRIITGANMSGKSTFLRTIGTNLVLAMMGAPVFALKLVFTPIEIHTSLHTNDSLAKRESYFYAELRRLRELIGELEKGRVKLILLDEILKGTNSADKQTGSIALIRQLMKYKVAGLFATHDLVLGELVNNYPDNVRNLCFEIRISGDRMEIDYKLLPGVCRNLNASFLMKNMGIILDEDTRV